MKRFYKTRQAAGICVSCNEKSVTKNYCQKHRQTMVLRGRATRARLRDEVLAGYGNKCTCCGETTRAFLTLDHVNGGGSRDRKENHAIGNKLYRGLIKRGFPSDFRILCMNCNFGRQFNNGICPHERH